MTSKNKDSHLYIKFEKTDRSLDIDLLPLKFSSDLILDLSSLETMDKTYFSHLTKSTRKLLMPDFVSLSY